MLIVFAFHQVCSQTCVPYSKKKSVDELVAKSSVVVEATIKAVSKRGKLFNVTAAIKKVYPTRNDGLQEKSTIKFGPVGKIKGCVKVKSNKNYILFLRKSEEKNFYWINYNPMKSSGRKSRSLKKLLCKNCLVPPSFKKSSKLYELYEKNRVKIKCKPFGKPRAFIVWYYNGILLTDKNIPKEFKIKTRKKGGASTLEIKKLETKYNDAVLVCSATNIASAQPANLTIHFNVIVSSVSTCKNDCGANYKGYCQNGGCCQLSGTEEPTCSCSIRYKGQRCQTRHYGNVVSVKQPNQYRHQQQVVAILGMCVAVVFVMLLCLAVYCLFKNKRHKLHLKLLHSASSTAEHTPVLSHENDQSATHRFLNSELSNDVSSCLLTTDNVAQSCLNRNESHQNSSFDRNNSSIHRSENGSRRSRLNGIAKNLSGSKRKLSNHHVALTEPNDSAKQETDAVSEDDSFTVSGISLPNNELEDLAVSLQTFTKISQTGVYFTKNQTDLLPAIAEHSVELTTLGTPDASSSIASKCEENSNASHFNFQQSNAEPLLETSLSDECISHSKIELPDLSVDL